LELDIINATTYMKSEIEIYMNNKNDVDPKTCACSVANVGLTVEN